MFSPCQCFSTVDYNNLISYIFSKTFVLGNECWKILMNLDKLHITAHLQDFKSALDALLAINLLVSNPVLPSNYSVVIENWRQAWYVLRENRDITTTNKIHILNDHLEV